MDLFEKAARFALDAHAGQVRKASGTPYILHPMEVAAIAASLTGDPCVLAAAMLHDTVEDTSVTAADIEREFGPRVAALVASETEDKHPELPKSESWRLRKEESLAHLAATDDDAVRILWLADKLSNVRSLHRSWREEGDAVWEHFNMRDPAQHRWYYRRVAELTEPLSSSDAWREYRVLVDDLFGAGE